MSYSEKPMYHLTVSEYIEITKTVFDEAVEKILQSKEQATHQTEHDQDVIFTEEVLKITGYTKATLYSKISRYEIPVISRRRPLTFSRKGIMQWLHEGKPCVIDQEVHKDIKK